MKISLDVRRRSGWWLVYGCSRGTRQRDGLWHWLGLPAWGGMGVVTCARAKALTTRVGGSSVEHIVKINRKIEKVGFM